MPGEDFLSFYGHRDGDERGRTIIPVEMRKKYGIEEGSALEVEDTGRGYC